MQEAFHDEKLVMANFTLSSRVEVKEETNQVNKSLPEFTVSEH